MEDKIEKILIGLILCGAILSLFFKNYLEFFSYIAILMFSMFSIHCIDKFNLNKRYKVLILVAMWLHIIGRMFLLYDTIYYDKILHLITPLIIIMIVDDYFKRIKLEYPKTIVLLVVVGMLSLFEIYEFLVSFALNINMQGVIDNNGVVLLNPIFDTMLDLIFGLLSCVSYLIYKGAKK